MGGAHRLGQALGPHAGASHSSIFRPLIMTRNMTTNHQLAMLTDELPHELLIREKSQESQTGTTLLDILKNSKASSDPSL